MGMHGYMSLHVCRRWKITFTSRFFPFTLLNQGRYGTVSLGLFSLSDYILLFFISLFSIYLFLLLLFLHPDHVFFLLSLYLFPSQVSLPSTPPPFLFRKRQPFTGYQATVVTWRHIKASPLLLRLEKVGQEEETVPKVAKRVRDRLFSFYYKFYKKTKLHICNTYAEDLSSWFLV